MVYPILLAAIFVALLLVIRMLLRVCGRAANQSVEELVKQLSELDRCPASTLWLRQESYLRLEIAELRRKLQDYLGTYRLNFPSPIVSDGLTDLGQLQIIAMQEANLKRLERELEHLYKCQLQPQLIKEALTVEIEVQLRRAIRWRSWCLWLEAWFPPLIPNCCLQRPQ